MAKHKDKLDTIQRCCTKPCVQLVPLSVGTSLSLLMKEKQEEIDTHHEHMQLSLKVVIEISLEHTH